MEHNKFDLLNLFLFGAVICALIHLGAQSHGNYDLKCWMEGLIFFQLITYNYLNVKRNLEK